MTIAQTAEPTSQKPLRLWPGVLAAVLVVLCRFVVPFVAPDATLFDVPLTILAMLGLAVLAGAGFERLSARLAPVNSDCARLCETPEWHCCCPEGRRQ